MLDGFGNKNAWALCTFAYSAGPGTEPILFEGRVNGKIVPARGPGKFGWNPVFEIEDTGKTYVLVQYNIELSLIFTRFAEMTDNEKNSISHRFRALEKLTEYLRTHEA